MSFLKVKKKKGAINKAVHVSLLETNNQTKTHFKYK